MSQFRRRRFLLTTVAMLSAPITSLAQQPDKVRRIGFLAMRSRSTPSNPDPFYDAFVQGMRELGYVEGKNLVIEWRFAVGKYERLPSLADELARLKLDVVVVQSTPGAEAMQRATSSIPIVMTGVIDPVAGRFAASLARPGGNITGLSVLTADTSQKLLELLKVMRPGLSRTAVLVNSGTASHSEALKSMQNAAQQLGIKVLPVDASTAEEIERGFAQMKRERADAVIVLPDGFFTGQRQQISELALRHRLLSMFTIREEAQAGGLMSYGPDLPDLFRRAASYVDKILKGAKPGELPIEQPTKIHLAINRKTAKALGITIPQELLLRADEVIE